MATTKASGTKASKPAPKPTTTTTTTKPKAAPKPTARAAASAAAKATPAPAAKPTAAAKLALKGVTLDQTTAPEIIAMTKKQLFERVRSKTGVKGAEARKVMDVVLDEIGAALVRGESLKLQPLGTMKVQRQKTANGADMVICKLRRKKPMPEGKDPLAAAAE